MARKPLEPPFPLEPDEIVVRRAQEIVARSRDLLRKSNHLVSPPHPRGAQKQKRQPPSSTR
jgi:hypothetical protein